MADATHIEWTDATWNPITGCSVISPGCTNCYAMRLAGTRLKDHPSRKGLTTESKAGPVWNGQVRFNMDWIEQPLSWTRPRRIFVCAHGDLFHEEVDQDWIAWVYGVAIAAHHLRGHTFQILTKRAQRANHLLHVEDFWRQANAYAESYVMERVDPLNRRADDARATLADYDPDNPPPGIWLGVSVEDQRRADERIPLLLDTPAAVRWISAEPLLGPIDLTSIDIGAEALDALAGYKSLHGSDSDLHDAGDPLDWVVVGGESGPGARPMHPDWARRIRDDCAAAGVPFFFKQWGDWAPFCALDESYDAEFYEPVPAGRDPESPRRCKREQLVMQRNGRVFPLDEWSREIRAPGSTDLAFLQGEGGMHFFRTGKKCAGRTLDGVTHDAFPTT